MNRYRYLIIGGGMTADAAAHGIRDVDPSGTIGLVSAEPHPPYNRPPLSKGLWKGDPVEGIWRPGVTVGVEQFLGRRIVAVDARGKRATDDRGEKYGFEQLLFATGGTPRRLPPPRDRRATGPLRRDRGRVYRVGDRRGTADARPGGGDGSP